jgi:hypothetical protein
MTQEEYVQAISSINEAVGNSLVGLPKMFSSEEAGQREDLKASVARERVAALNAIWKMKGVRFTYQRAQGHETRVNRSTTARWTDTFLYLRVE